MDNRPEMMDNPAASAAPLHAPHPEPPVSAPVLTVTRAGQFRDMQPVSTHRTTAQAMDYLLLWVVRGEVTGHIASQPIHARPGELLVFEPRIAHHYAAQTTGPWEWLWVHFEGPAAHDLFNDLRGFGAPAAPLGWHEHIRERFMEVLLAADQTTGDAPRPTAAFHAGASLYSLLGLILDQLELNRRLPTDTNGLNTRELQRYIHDHLTEPLQLQDLAQRAHLSPTHFSRLFKSTFGVSPMRYVIERRIERAATLLTTTDLKLAHIAQSIGYSDPYYFSRLFRRVTGQTPSNYRRTAS